MKFSLLSAVRNRPDRRYPLPAVYDDYLSDTVLGEKLGFTRSWFGEHHFRECQWAGSPLLLASAAAMRTTSIRLGTAVSLLPFHDPRRIAEDVAIADILSHGRFDFGFGPGSQFPEDHEIGSMQMVCVGDSTDAAWESCSDALEYFVNFYAQRRNLQGEPAEPTRRITAQMIREGRASIWHASVGTPDDVIRGLTPIVSGRMGRITELVLAFRHAGMRTPETHRSMQLFAEQVMPALQEIAAEAAANPPTLGPPASAHRQGHQTSSFLRRRT